MNLFTKTLTGAAIAGALILGSASAAMAAPVAGVPSAVPAAAQTVSAVTVAAPAGAVSLPTGVCTTGATDSRAGSSNYLPVHRWAGSSSQLHSLLLSTEHLDNVFDSARRHTVVGSLLSVSNSIMGVTSGLTSMAINFCPIDQAGGVVDRLSGNIGNIFITTPLGLLLLIVVIITFAAQTMRHGTAPLAGIATKAVILGVLGLMVAGAANSRGGDGSGAEYVPGKGSPGWFLSTINNTVSAIASGPAAALEEMKPFAEGNAWSPSDPAKSNILSCDAYIDGMKSNYRETYAGSIGKMSAGVPLIVSDMFETTGLRTWRTAQFGMDVPSSSGTFDDQAWCRLLDWNADTKTSTTRKAIAGMGVVVPEASAAVWKSKAFQPSTPEDYDRSLIAWSACQLKTNSGDWSSESNWKVKSEFASGNKTNIVAADCQKWMTQKDDPLKAFAWPTTVAEVRADASGEDLATYVNTIHGNANQEVALAAAYTYPVAALSILASFGLIAGGIMVAKAMMLMLMLSIIVMLVVLLLPGKRSDQVMKVLSMAIGMTMFVFGAQLIFSVIALITKVISGIGQSLLQNLGGLDVLWTGLSPLMAVFLIHYIFKSMLGMPSPFTMKGAVDWGNKMTRGGGGAMFGGAANMLGRSENKMAGASKQAASSVKNAAMTKINAAKTTGSAATATPRKGSSSAAGAAPIVTAAGTGAGAVLPGTATAGTAATGAGVQAGGTAVLAGGAALAGSFNGTAVTTDDKGRVIEGGRTGQSTPVGTANDGNPIVNESTDADSPRFVEPTETRVGAAAPIDSSPAISAQADATQADGNPIVNEAEAENVGPVIVGPGATREGASAPSAISADAAALAGVRAATRSERAESRDAIRADTEAAKAWANETDRSILADSQKTGVAKGVTGARNDIAASAARVRESAAETAQVFRDRGIVAGSSHAVQVNGKAIAKNAGKAALVTAGVVTGAAFVGPIALVAAPVYGAAKVYGVYARQSRRNRETEAVVTAQFAESKQRQIATDKQSARKTSKATTAASAGPVPVRNVPAQSVTEQAAKPTSTTSIDI